MSPSRNARHALRIAGRVAKRLARRTARSATRLAMVAGSLPGTVAFAEPGVPLASPDAEHAAQIYGLIDQKAAQTCDRTAAMSRTDLRRAMEEYSQCVHQAVENAVMQQDSAPLSAMHATRQAEQTYRMIREGAAQACGLQEAMARTDLRRAMEEYEQCADQAIGTAVSALHSEALIAVHLARQAEPRYRQIQAEVRQSCHYEEAMARNDIRRAMSEYGECANQAMADALARQPSPGLRVLYLAQVRDGSLHPVSAPQVVLLTPAVTEVATTMSVKGEIHARAEVSVAAEGEPGRVQAVCVEVGDHVTQGQLLARLDDSVLALEVERLRAVLEQARARAASSAAMYRRAHAAAWTLPVLAVQERRAMAAVDAAGVKVAEAQLAQGQARLARTRIVAPVDGVVLTRQVQPGQSVATGTEVLFRIATGGELEMRAQVAGADLPTLKVGHPAAVQVPGLPHPFEGQVRLLGAVVDPQTQQGEVRIALHGAPDGELRPGTAVSASVRLAEVQRPVLPKAVVLTDAQGTYVYVVGNKGQLQRRPVHVGGTVEAGLVIDRGLAPTESVVDTAAGPLPREGETVQVAAAAAPMLTSR